MSRQTSHQLTFLFIYLLLLSSFLKKQNKVCLMERLLMKTNKMETRQTKWLCSAMRELFWSLIFFLIFKALFTCKRNVGIRALRVCLCWFIEGGVQKMSKTLSEAKSFLMKIKCWRYVVHLKMMFLCYNIRKKIYKKKKEIFVFAKYKRKKTPRFPVVRRDESVNAEVSVRGLSNKRNLKCRKKALQYCL